jgi:hypothetical protein
MRRPHCLSVKEVYDFFALSPQVEAYIKALPSWAAVDWLGQKLVNQLSKKLEISQERVGEMRALATVKVFETQGSPLYKIANEFGKVLAKADCKVSLDYLPFDNTIRCIEFPDDIMFDLKDGDWGRCAYVACCEPDKDILLEGEEYTRRVTSSPAKRRAL